MMVKLLLLFAVLLGCTGCQTLSKLDDLKWQLRLEKALAAGQGLQDDGLCPVGNPRRDRWEKRARLAVPGTPRKKVERLFPVYNWPDDGPHPHLVASLENSLSRKEIERRVALAAASGNKPRRPNMLQGQPLSRRNQLQYQWYYVAPDFIAVFVYDFSGPLDPSAIGPAQQLVTSPVIVHHDFWRLGRDNLLGGTPAEKHSVTSR